MDVCVRDAVASSGERARLACWFRRHAETTLFSAAPPERIDDLEGKFAIAGRARQVAAATAPQTMRTRAKLFAESLAE